jgi:hypothetical protein
VDTHIIVSSMSGVEGSSRAVLRAFLEGKVQPILAEALFLQYEDVLARPELTVRSPLSSSERQRLLAAFLSCANGLIFTLAGGRICPTKATTI